VWCVNVVQVVFFMYLWSIDIDAVLTAMSCFRLLCEEAEIRCGADELAVTQLLPNYAIYSELAAASTVLTTGQQHMSISDALELLFEDYMAGKLSCY